VILESGILRIHVDFGRITTFGCRGIVDRLSSVSRGQSCSIHSAKLLHEDLYINIPHSYCRVLVAQLRFRLPLSARNRTAIRRFVAIRGPSKRLCHIYLFLFLELLAVRDYRSRLHHGNDTHTANHEIHREQPTHNSTRTTLISSCQDRRSQLRLHSHDNTA
jgi:hypothetical protein